MQTHAHGFTLLDLLITLSISISLTAIGIPAFNSNLQEQRLRKASTNLFASAALARVAQRPAHFFPAGLVATQFQALESPLGEAGVLRVDALQLEEPVAALVALDWLGRLDEDGERYVLLVVPQDTLMAPLVERLLLARQPNTARFWSESRWSQLTLAQALASTPLPPVVQEMAEGPSVASG